LKPPQQSWAGRGPVAISDYLLQNSLQLKENHMRIYMLLVTAMIISISATLQAGLVVNMMQKTKGMDTQSKQTMYIEKDRLRMEMSGEDEYRTVIFRGDKNVFWVVDSKKKSYFEMTQDDIAKLKTQMESMQKMMMEQMKNMPEEQRKMMESMMPSSMSNQEKPKTKYEKAEGNVKVGKWTTTHYVGTTNGKKIDELWTADWSQVGFNRSEFSVMTKMADFFSALSQEASDFMKVGSAEWEKEMGISGMPVRWLDYLEGGGTSEGNLQDISRKDLQSSLFELPAGYSKDQSPFEKQGQGMNPYMQE
jgi:hypothetical protein